MNAISVATAASCSVLLSFFSTKDSRSEAIGTCSHCIPTGGLSSPNLSDCDLEVQTWLRCVRRIGELVVEIGDLVRQRNEKIRLMLRIEMV